MIPDIDGKVKLTQAAIEILPNYRKRTAREYSSACPRCGGDAARDTDRFRFWPEDGNFWCRQCELSGFVVSDTSDVFRLTPEMKDELERRKRKAREAERQRHLSAIEKLQKNRHDIIYHRNLNGNTRYIQTKWGVTPDTIDQFKIGYCHACPTSPQSDSITIPYYWNKKLINLRHRLGSPNGGGKYRPEMAGLPSAIFNIDSLKGENWTILVEGEFKAMVLWQTGLPVVGIPGATNFKEKWVRLFSQIKRIFIALDPGAEVAAWRIGQMLSKAGVMTRVVTLPEKPDDMFVIYGCDTATFCRYLELGRLL